MIPSNDKHCSTHRFEFRYNTYRFVGRQEINHYRDRHSPNNGRIPVRVTTLLNNPYSKPTELVIYFSHPFAPSGTCGGFQLIIRQSNLKYPIIMSSVLLSHPLR